MLVKKLPILLVLSAFVLMSAFSLSLQTEQKVFSIMRWIAIPFILIELLELPRDIKKWYLAKKIYHRIPLNIIKTIKRISSESLKSWPLRIFPIMLIIITLLEIRYQTKGSYYPRLIFLILLLTSLQRHLRFLVPPSAIFLTASNPQKVKLLTHLTRAFKSYNIVSLVDIKEHVFFLDYIEIFPGLLRVRNRLKWRSMVQYLMDVLPFIILDTRTISKGVSEEVKRIIKNKQTRKTIFIIEDRGDSPLLDFIGITTFDRQKLGFNLCSESDLFNVFKQKLNNLNFTAAFYRGSMVIKNEWPELSFCYQIIYDDMNNSIPVQFRNPESMNSMLIKGHYIMDYTYKIFLNECKNADISEFNRKLIEDIPTIVSEEYEFGWLQNSRELDEIENIFVSALELAEEEHHEFNIASSYVKLGKLARFKREWNNAIDYLDEAILRLTELSLLSTKQNIFRELADAYFILGEVYMVKYRKQNKKKYNEQAVTNFQNSIKLDKLLGQDYIITQRRIDDLE